MKTITNSILIFLLCICVSQLSAQKKLLTQFEKSSGFETATYKETIEYYKNLATTFSSVKLDSFGITDAGKPLHLITYNPKNEFNFEVIRKSQRILLINNGIHPGESDGIDATMMMIRDFAQGKIEPPKNTVIVIIPIYNIGGSLNRNNGTRANQNGPVAYGFRGNARNYDLNRDFIKSDSDNSKTFAEIYHLVKPDVFIDNHVSNGADYQYVLTHLFTQHNKMAGELGDFLHGTLMPELEENLAKKSWDITPYVNVFNQVPETGFSQFMDYPRYSTGYTTLWNSFGLMLETHMLKPYKQRVEGTYEFMLTMIQLTEKYSDAIKNLRKNAHLDYKVGNTYYLDWKVDSAKTSTLNFKGYEGEIIKSEVTGLDRLRYDRNKPFNKEVTYYNYFTPFVETKIPSSYIIPQGWHDVIELLKINNVALKPIQHDTIIQVESYRIVSYDTRKSPYEGHYQHYNTQVEKSMKQIAFRSGDFMVSTQQAGVRYLLETLEPEAPDSFFNWNFFDTILQQKEGFSPYVWEDEADKLLEENPELKKEFLDKKSSDEEFSKNWYAQLDWLFKRSYHYEKAHMQYPIYRIN